MAISTARLFAVTCGLALAYGCASEPRPTEALARAAASIEQADQAGAQRTDPAGLDMAKKKFADANAAADKGKMKVAAQLAQQSALDAQAASAKARAAASEKAAEEVGRATETLRDETTRPATTATP